MNPYLKVLLLPELLDIICSNLEPRDILNIHTVLKCSPSYKNFRRIMNCAYHTVKNLKDENTKLLNINENLENEQTIICMNCHETSNVYDSIKCSCWSCNHANEPTWYCDSCGKQKCEYRCGKKFSELHERFCDSCVKWCRDCVRDAQHNYYFYDYCGNCDKCSKKSKTLDD